MKPSKTGLGRPSCRGWQQESRRFNGEIRSCQPMIPWMRKPIHSFRRLSRRWFLACTAAGSMSAIRSSGASSKTPRANRAGSGAARSLDAMVLVLALTSFPSIRTIGMSAAVGYWTTKRHPRMVKRSTGNRFLGLNRVMMIRSSQTMKTRSPFKFSRAGHPANTRKIHSCYAGLSVFPLWS